MSLKVNVPVLLLAFIGSNFVNADSRIVGGEYCKVQDHPFIVAVLGPVSCGGSLLNLRWVLTASHCIKKQSISSTYIRAGYTAPSYLIQVRRAKRAVTHPKFDILKMRSVPSELRYDIALIFVEGSFHVSKVLRPAVLPTPGFTRKCTITTAIGAGSTEPVEKKSMSITYARQNPSRGYFGRPLKCVDLHVTDVEHCSDTYPGSTIDESVLCTMETKYGQDACQGDSGGPLVCTVGDTTAVVGIVSAGKGCGVAFSAATFTKVEKYLEFISDTMAKNRAFQRLSWRIASPTVFFSTVLRSVSEMRLV